jgi:signal transduction histidine kinase
MMMTGSAQSFIGWFSPPVLSSADATRRARSFSVLAWSFFGVLTVMLSAAIVATPETFERRGTSIVMVGMLVLLLHALNRRGRTDVASWVLVLGLTGIVTQRAWYTGGIHAPVALFYVMFVLLAAALLGIRGSILTALACVVSATLLAGAGLAGWLPPPAPGASMAVAFVAITLGLAVTLLSLTLLLRDTAFLSTEDLVTMFVHDIRSPLTVIMARLSMLRGDVADGTESAVHADAAMADAMRINRMANNLLDIGRLEATRLPLHRHPMDFAELARSVVQSLRAMDPTRRLEVIARVPVVCDCDPELLRRVIENLVSNALKHTPPDGHVLVRVDSGRGCVRLSVQDEGRGIPKDSRERMFERYSASGMRAESGHHSVGLGLAFCKLAVGAHGGRIWVEDAVPHGSTFIVELPVHT